MLSKRFILVDGSSLLYRAFYALPLLQTAEGAYTNAVYGFANMLQKLLNEYAPDYLAVAFDKGKKTFRNEMFAAYKGTRKPTPPELSSQIPMLHEFLAALGVPLIEEAGYEADDILGTLAVKAAREDVDVLVVTGDRDALQLVRENIRVLFTRKGMTDLLLYDEKLFLEEYGFPPKGLIDMKGLMGDASDNIPGVPGIGPKTAKKLLIDCGSLEGVYERLAEISGKKLKENLASNREKAFLSKDLATIRCDMSLEFAPDSYVMKPKGDELQAFFQRYEMKSLATAFASFAAADGVREETAPELSLHTMDDEEAKKAFAEKAEEQGFFSIAACFEGKVPDMKARHLVLCAGGEVLLAEAAELACFSSLFEKEDIQKIVHEYKPFLHCGMDFAPCFDVSLAAYLLAPAASQYDMASLAAIYLPSVNAAEAAREGALGAAWCAVLLEKLYPVLKKRLEEQQLLSLYETMEFPLVEVLAAMEQAGIYVDRAALHEKSREISTHIAHLTAEIYDLAKGEFNINSPKQLSAVLFERLDLQPPMGTKKTKTGYSTNAEVLEAMRFDHPILEKILSYRFWTKLQSTYLDSMEGLISPRTKRIHTRFNQTVTATGRLSSSEPNLQNIPVRTDEGRQIRALFEPSDGYDALMSADYSQIELRILAHLSEDKNFLEAFLHGQDIHARTASEVFGVPMEAVTPDLRRKAKAVNFGIVYGISDYGLSKDLHISRQEAADYIASYFEKCSGIKRFIDGVVEKAHSDGFVTTIFGRRRDLPAIKSSNYNQRTLAERMAMNTPIQGSAADIIKLAMIKTHRALQEGGFKSRILLQVHDELVLEIMQNEKEQVADLVRDAMENVVQLSVPLSVDIHTGENWAAAK